MLPTKAYRDYAQEHATMWPDDPRDIATAMGGREFFFNIGASRVHRIGLFKGLGFSIPKGESTRYIDFVRVHREEGKTTFSIEFSIMTEDNLGFNYQQIAKREGVPIRQLANVYQEETAK